MSGANELHYRLAAWALSVARASGFIGIMSLLLTDGRNAAFLLDRNSTVFDYAFTIQNLMWLIFFGALAEVAVRHRRARVRGIDVVGADAAADRSDHRHRHDQQHDRRGGQPAGGNRRPVGAAGRSDRGRGRRHHRFQGRIRPAAGLARRPAPAHRPAVGAAAGGVRAIHATGLGRLQR